MTAEEFGLWQEFYAEEPVSPAMMMAVAEIIAGLANGPFKPPSGSNVWQAAHFLPKRWQGEKAPAPPPTLADLRRFEG